MENFIENHFLSKEKSEKRIEICKVCEHYINFTNMCNKCMCFMPMKVKLAPASCPEHKWLHETINL